ncbi:hypothetical protein N9949_03105, partial [Akkermansiaceae bacterium]|nr:hypothetical protein [Akkermansiaceae bacterium]
NVILKRTGREPVFFDKKNVVIFDYEWFLLSPWDFVMWNIYYSTFAFNNKCIDKFSPGQNVEDYFNQMCNSWLDKNEHQNTDDILGRKG